MHSNFGLLFFCWIALLVTCRADDQPNFIIIFTDDQGYNDLGCFGSPNIQTPNIDRMAADGMRFTNFYSGASVCTPSRAALLTGCYPERVGNLPVLFPHSDRGLNPDETTMAEMLQKQGYATACFGKWHLGHQRDFLPTQHGFDTYFGIPYSNDMGIDVSMELADDIKLLEGRTLEDFRSGTVKLPPLFRGNHVIEWPADQTQLTRRYTEEATRFIADHATEPFFVYLPHTMPHIPLYASDRFRGKSKAGLYGDTLEEIDWSVGEILKTLEELNLDERTMVIYTSDNGPWDLEGNATDKVKGNMNRRIGGSAHPLRGHKFSKWEGGMRVPCVMRWPGQIPAGTTCEAITASIDLFPTIAELSGAPAAGGQIIDGKSIVALIEGQANATTPHDAYFYRTNGVRSGKWKWIHGQLYDLEADIAESNNVAEAFPEVVEQLKQRLKDHIADMKNNARPPAYVQRPAHPLAGLDGWMVETGSWTVRKDKTLRQSSDWTDSEAVSPRLAGAVLSIELEAKLLDDQGGFGLALLDPDTQHRAALSLSNDVTKGHVLELSNGNQTVEIAGEIEAKQWYRMQLQITTKNIIAYLNGTRIGELGLDDALDFTQIALTGTRSKSDYRNLRVTGPDEIVLLKILTVAGP